MNPCALIRIARAAVALLLLPPGQAAAGLWLTGYYASYSAFPPASMAPSEVDYAALTHVIHWPVVPRADGSLVDPDTYGLTREQSADLVTRAHAAGTRALLGFGGDAATVGDGWRGATAPANRARFIDRMVALMRERGYDGIDINWEELGPADEAAFIAFIGDLRRALDAISPRPLLTWVPTTGEQPPLAATAATAQHFDQINLQTYVMSGPYPGWVTWFNSPLHNGGARFPSTGGPLPSADVEVDRYVAAGIPIDRLGLGMQFDGFVWAGGAGTGTGGVAEPRQDFDDARPPTLTVLRQADVVQQYGQAPGCRRQFDAVALVPWIGCDRARDDDDRFISLEDEQSIREKARYATGKGLGGLFVFELSGDFQPAAQGRARHPLLYALKAAMRPPVAADDAYTTTTALAIAAPGVLANDRVDAGLGATAQLVSAVSSGTLLLRADGSFDYTPASGFSGAASFSYRVEDAYGNSSAAARVVITVNPEPALPLRPPEDLALQSVLGNSVTLRWTAPVDGARPTAYALEGGVLPGEVLASLAVDGSETSHTLTLPAGRYYARIHSLAEGRRSAASNEIRFAVGLPPTPDAPAHLLGLVDGSRVALSWTLPTSGPAPTGLLLTVSGAIETTLKLPVGERFSQADVPPGSYRVTLTALNDAGASAASNALTLNVPASCSGAPETPVGLQLEQTGGRLSASWQAPSRGTAVAGYVVEVGGGYVGRIATTERTLSGQVAPGRYSVSVAATNACGSSAPTAAQTVTVP